MQWGAVDSLVTSKIVDKQMMNQFLITLSIAVKVELVLFDVQCSVVSLNARIGRTIANIQRMNPQNKVMSSQERKMMTNSVANFHFLC